MLGGSVGRGTGLGPPRLERGFVSRPELSQQLDAAVEEEALILVQAPSGFGKTSMVASWLIEHEDWHVIWFDSAGSSARPRGLSDLLETLLASTARGAPPRPDLPDAMHVRHLLTELSRRDEARLVLVIDRFEEMLDDVDVPSLLGALTGLDGLSVVILSRREVPDFDLLRPWRLHRLGRSRLAWDHATARRALIAHEVAPGAEPVSDAMIALLVEYSDGCPAAIVDAARSWSSERHPSRAGGGRTPARIIAEWHLARVRQNYDAVAVQLILTAASLIELPDELVPALPGIGSSELLHSMAAEGVLGYRSSAFGSNGAYTVTAALREELALIAELERPEDTRREHALAAAYYRSREGSAPFLESFHLAMSGDLSHAIGVLRRELLVSGTMGPERIASVLRVLPVSEIVDDPVLAALALAFDRSYPGRLLVGQIELDGYLLSVPAERRRSLPPGERMLVEAAAVHALLARGALKDALRRGEMALAISGSTTAAGDVGFARALNFLNCALAEAYLLQLRFDSALAAARRVLAAGSQERWIVCAFRAAAVSALVYALSGEREAMLDEMRAAELYYALSGLAPSSLRIPLLLAKFVDAWNSDDREALVEVSSTIAAHPLAHGMWGEVGAFASGESQFRSGQQDHGIARLARLTERIDHDREPPLFRGTALVTRAIQFIDVGRPGVALRLVDGVTGDRRHTLCFAAVRARALLSLANPRAVIEATDGCLSLGHRHAPITLHRVHLYRAIAHAELGRSRTALVAFKHAILSSPAAWRRKLLLDVPFASVTTLWSALEHDPVFGQNDELRELFDWWTDGPAREMGPVIPTLSERELELLLLMREDTSFADIARAQFVSINTVKTQAKSLYRKIGASSRSEAVDIAYAIGLFEMRPPSR